MYDPKFGLSAGYRGDVSPQGMLAKLREFGFTALELNPGYLDEHREELAEVAGEFAELTFHLPHSGENGVLAEDEPADDAVFERYRRIVAGAARAGVRTFVLHLKNRGGQLLEEYWDRSVGFARRMGDLVASHGAVVGIENCYPVVRYGPVASRFLGEVDHPAVGLTLDTGHFWSALCEDAYGRHLEDPVFRTPEGEKVLNDRLMEMVGEAGDRIVDIHIHNIRPGDWLDHQPVDPGVMEYGPFFSALEGGGYDGPVIVEIRGTPDADGAPGWSGFESSARYLRGFMPRRKGERDAPA